MPNDCFGGEYIVGIMPVLESIFGFFVCLIFVVSVYLGIRFIVRGILFGPNIFSGIHQDQVRISESLDRVSKNLERLLEAEMSESRSNEK